MVYGSAFVGLVVFLSIGHQTPNQQIAADTLLIDSHATSRGDEPVPVDDLIATRVMVTAAERVDMPLKLPIQNELVSLEVRNQISQQSETQIVKPQIVEIDTDRRTVQKYRVKSGDTVSKIASKFEIDAQTIRWANNLEASSAVRAGKVLKIPPTDSIIYTVQAGDTVQGIARQYDASAQRIIAFNNLEVSGIKRGKTLVIPDGALPASERPGYVAPNTTTTTTYNYQYSPGYSGGDSTVINPWSRINVDVYAYRHGAGNGGYNGQCTWWAWERRNAIGRKLPSGALGNAREWAYNLRVNHGYTVNSTPKVGAVLQTSGGSYNGHVGVVEAINPNGSIVISEMNYIGNYVVNLRTIPADAVSSFNYIH